MQGVTAEYGSVGIAERAGAVVVLLLYPPVLARPLLAKPSAQERGAPKRGGRCCGRVPPMFKGGKKAPQATAPDQSSSQNVHFDWEQRDFTQTIQLGMTQLTAFLNEFGARRHLTLHPRACCNDWRAVCRWNHARANCSAKR